MLPVRRVITAAAIVVVALTAAGLAPAHAASAAVAATHGLGARKPESHRAPAVSVLDMPPDQFDLRQWAEPVGNQGQVGSCVTWAINYAMLGWYMNYNGRSGPPFAPMYTYSQINGGVDGGSNPLDALRVAYSQGGDTRADYTQGDYDWWDQPTNAERANASHYKISGYTNLFSGAGQSGSVTAIKNAIATHHPVAIIIPVRHGFDYLGASPDAVDNDSTSMIRGYHEVLGIAYDSAGLIIQNSWGTSWGNAGFGRLSWSVVTADVWEADIMNGLAPDVQGPTVSTPTVTLASSGTVTGSVVPYTVSWSATAGSSGPVTEFDVAYQTDGGAFVPVSLASPTSTSVTLNLAVGHTYRVSVQAKAGADTESDVEYSASFKPTLAQETDTRIAYAGVWSNVTGDSASGHAVRLSSALNGRATFVATGRRFSWIATKGANRGSARVYVDGVLKTTVNSYAATAEPQRILYTINFGSSAKHTIAIVNLATAGHPRVDVDAFLVSS